MRRRPNTSVLALIALGAAVVAGISWATGVWMWIVLYSILAMMAAKALWGHDTSGHDPHEGRADD